MTIVSIIYDGSGARVSQQQRGSILQASMVRLDANARARCSLVYTAALGYPVTKRHSAVQRSLVHSFPARAFVRRADGVSVTGIRYIYLECQAVEALASLGCWRFLFLGYRLGWG